MWQAATVATRPNRAKNQKWKHFGIFHTPSFLVELWYLLMPWALAVHLAIAALSAEVAAVEAFSERLEQVQQSSEELVFDYDFWMSDSCRVQRRSILVADDFQTLGENVFTCQALKPEGISADCICRDFLRYHEDHAIQESMLLWNSPKAKPSSGTKYIFCGIDTMPQNPVMDFAVDCETLILPLLHTNHLPIQVIEFFAGGCGGWQTACEFLSMRLGLSFRTLALELDLLAAQAYAIGHDVPLISGMKKVDPAIATVYKDVIVHTDVSGDNWLELASAWGPDIAVISPPCQPWSSAGSGSGLMSEQGQLVVQSIAKCKVLRPKVIALENVSAFGTHEHFQYLMRALRWAGYILHHSQTIDASDILPVSRSRWLAIALRVSEGSNTPCPFQMWCPVSRCVPNTWDVMLSDEHLQDPKLVPSKEVIDVSSRHDLLPPAKRRLVSKNGVIASRCFDGSEKIPTIVASYGSQHKFSLAWLQEKGLLNHFVLDQNGKPRYWHPLELWILHGAFGKFFMNHDWETAYRHIGNQICPPHALLIMANSLNCLGKVEHKCCVSQIIFDFIQSRVCATTLKYCRLATGVLASDSEEQLTQTQIHEIDRFQQGLTDATIPEGKVWTKNGYENLALNDPVIEVPATVPFPVFEKTALCVNGQMFFAMVQTDVPLVQLLQVWDDAFQAIDHEISDTVHMLVPAETWEPSQDPFPKLQVVIHERNLYVAKPSPEVTQWFMGLCHNSVFTPTAHLATLDEFCSQIVSGGISIEGPAHMHHKVAQYIHAFAACHVLVHVDQTTFQMSITIQGAVKPRAILALFWQNVLSPRDLQTLGLCMKAQHSSDTTTLTWEANNPVCPMPMHLLQKCLVSLAFRSILNTLQDENGIKVHIKIFADFIWTGKLPSNFSVATLKQCLHATAWMLVGKALFRVIHKGCQPPDSMTMREADISSHRQAAVFHFVLQMQGGGYESGTKSGHRIQVKNAIAASLLEEGYELSWVTKTVENISSKVPAKDVARILHQKNSQDKLRAALDFVRQCEIELPKVVPAKSSQSAGVAKRKKLNMMPNPENYRALEGTLKNENGQNTPYVPKFGGQLTGYHMCAPHEALPWIRAGEKLSKDELCLIVFGELTESTTLEHANITLPCIDERGRQVLIACTLVQFGERSVKPQQGDGHKVDADGTILAAITWWKHDWKDQWDDICQNPYKSLRSVAGIDEVLVSVWGKAYRNGKLPTTANDASSVQVHCLLKEAHIQNFLKLSGYNLLWVTPKNTDGKPHPDWKLIWLNQQIDFQAATVLAAKLPATSGLACQRNRFAIRVPKADFATAWAKIYPSDPVPVEVDTSRLYKIESLPYGVNPKMLKEWSDHHSWVIKPLRPLGPKAWLIGCGSEPPAGPLHFNSQPVLLRELKGRSHQGVNPIVAGPRPSAARSDDANKGFPGLPPLATDPWSNWKGTKPANPPVIQPSNVGPTEQQITQQADRLSKLEDVVLKIQQGQTAQGETIEKIQVENKRRDLEIRQHLDHRLNTIKNDLDKSFAAAVQQQSAQFSANMEEIKNMLRAPPKRKEQARGTEDMSD
eukprot:s3705_g3.t1